MRLLHFLWSGEIGGAERAIYQLVRQQLKEDWDEVGVLFARAHGPYVDAFRSTGCRVEALNARTIADVSLVPRVLSRIRRYDIHHFHSVEPPMFWASIASGNKVRVFTERGGAQSFRSLRKKLRYAGAAPVLRRYFHAYSGNTQHAASVAAERYGLPAECVHVTYNGIEPELLAPTRPRDAVRNELGVSERVTLIGTSAYLKSCKRVDWLLEACARLTDVDYKILVVGDGPQRVRLREIARMKGISEQLTITGMTWEALDLAAAMDLFVLPSNAEESFGNAVVEAMALGIPSVVFSDSPGVCEHIRSGETGFVVAGIDELTGIMRDVAQDPTRAREIGRRGAAFVRSTYTPKHMSSAYRRLYEHALTRAATS
jgi:glycosyltransferase involved in cell wall biosynthesis